MPNDSRMTGQSPQMMPAQPPQQKMGTPPQQLMGAQPQQMMAQPQMAHDGAVGHLYMQTNELHNSVVHYRRSADGGIAEVERTSTGGGGSGGFSPVAQVDGAPNDFEGAGSVILTPDRRFLFATNAGDNSVSSFRVEGDGRLTLLDLKPTGNPVEGRSGTAKSLDYCPAARTLYVLHSFGPDHIRLMAVDDDGSLWPRPERYTMNTHDKPDRVATMLVVSPDQRFVLVGTTFDEPPTHNPDGSPILWVHKHSGTLKSIASNSPDPDGLAVFRVFQDGSLSAPKFHDGHGGSPWNIAFLHSRPDTFLLGYAVADGVAMCHIDDNGNVQIGNLVKIDTSGGVPTELCWLTVSPDDRTVYATPFGYSYLSSYHVDGQDVSIARDPACPKVPGDGTYRALNSTVSSGPSDGWISPDGAYFYQIYGNASKLVGYATQPDGSLHEVTSVPIPYNSPQGLAGF